MLKWKEKEEDMENVKEFADVIDEQEQEEKFVS